MRIWKYSLRQQPVQSIQMPEGAKVLCVQTQGNQPNLWALVDEKKDPTVTRKFAVHGTGNPMADGDPGTYVGTFQLYGGDLVFHVFEVDSVG